MLLLSSQNCRILRTTSVSYRNHVYDNFLISSFKNCQCCGFFFESGQSSIIEEPPGTVKRESLRLDVLRFVPRGRLLTPRLLVCEQPDIGTIWGWCWNWQIWVKQWSWESLETDHISIIWDRYTFSHCHCLDPQWSEMKKCLDWGLSPSHFCVAAEETVFIILTMDI